PGIQFIVSTHSPIPLLGAPKSSVFFVIKRDKLEGSILKRLDDSVPIRKLLPNAILGSPLFELDDYSPVDSQISELLVQDNFEDALYSYLLKKKFDEFNSNKEND